MRKNEEEQGSILLHDGKMILLGGVTALAVSLVLLLLAGACVTYGMLGRLYTEQLVVGACVLGSLAGGAFAVSKCRERRIIVGAAVGGTEFLLQLTVALLLFGPFPLEKRGVGMLFGSLCGGSAAGLLSLASKRKLRKRRRR